MIIEGKANRQQSEPVDPRKRLDFNAPEKISRVPIYFALLITGIAAYLKSAFPAQSQGEASPLDNGLSSANSSAPRGGRMAPGQHDIDNMTTGSIGDEGANNAIGGSLHGWNSGFSMPDPVSLNYAAGSSEFLGPQVAAFFPAAFNYHPQNDNEAGSAGQQGPVTIPDRQGPGTDQPSDPIVDEDEPTPDNDDDDDDDNAPTTGNRAPTVAGPVRLRDVFAGQVMLIGLSDLLFGAADPDGDILTINDIVATGGTMVQTSNGWSFATLPGMLGLITFTYNISDGLIEILQTASLQIVRNTVLLTPWDDVFVGTPWDDDIDGLAGDDIIDARAGNDVVVGGLGDDHINGGDGDDQLFGGMGDDVIFGGRGNDLIGGGAGDDRLFGEDGDDTLEGDEGEDLLMGGAGNDILDGGVGDDELDGEDGDDVIVAGAGDDVARGGAGRDALQGNDGHDELFGGAEADLIDGGAGDDELEGNEGDDVLVAGTGDDVASGHEGADVIDGDDGDDELYGGDGDDVIDGGLGDDVIEGNGDNDTLIAAAGDDVVSGGDGDDQLHGDEGDDTLLGDAGDDVLDGGEGSDTLDGGIGDDTLLGAAGDDELYGGAGDDLILAGSGDDEIAAGQGDDTIMGDAGHDLINGGDGHDTLDYSEFTADIHLDFEAGIAWSAEIGEDLFEDVEEVVGGQGNDTFVFGETTAIISGGLGDDLFIFTVSDETLANNDTQALSRQLMFQILDFVVGDRVHVADYELSHRAERLEEERFGEIYDELEEGFEAGLPIRVTHAYYDDMDHTIIEADVDRNDFYEISITLDGVQLPLTIGHHVA